jgi:CO dehydrogenase maturation factor
MCLATTKEQMIEASKIVREHLRSEQKENGVTRKIAVCGKGGVGKSTIVVLLANVLLEEGYSIAVMDTDESNPGLSRLCGFDGEPAPLMDLLSQVPEGQSEPDAEWLRKDQIAFEDVPAEYVVEKDKFKFLMVGKIEDPFQGCACTMADITRDLVRRLDTKEKEIVVIDTEAGVESFGRGVERSVDTVLVIVEPSFQSIALAERIHYMARGMGIKRIRAILNKVNSAQSEQKMIDELKKKSIAVLGTIGFDNEINEAGFEGRALGGESGAKNDIKQMMKTLLAAG